jgi:hypothetical protein
MYVATDVGVTLAAVAVVCSVLFHSAKAEAEDGRSAPTHGIDMDSWSERVQSIAAVHPTGLSRLPTGGLTSLTVLLESHAIR